MVCLLQAGSLYTLSFPAEEQFVETIEDVGGTRNSFRIFTRIPFKLTRLIKAADR